MDELRREYIIPVHLNHTEMINCSYLPNKKSKSRAGSTPYAVRGKRNVKSKYYENKYSKRCKSSVVRLK